MELQKQLITIPFVGGVQSKIDPIIVDRGQLLTLKNYCFTNDGTLTRRNGTASNAGNSLVGCAEQAVLNGELLSIDNTYTVQASSADGLIAKGQVSPCVLQKQSIARAIAGASNAIGFVDAAIIGSVSLFVYQDTITNFIYYSMYDEAGNSVLVSNVSIDSTGSGRFPRCCALNGRYVIMWANGTSIKANSIIVNQTNLQGVQTPVSGNLHSATSKFEIDGNTSQNFGLLVYDSNTVGVSIGALLFNTDGSAHTGETVVIGSGALAQDGSACINIAEYSNTTMAIFVPVTSSTTMWYADLTSSGGAITFGLGTSTTLQDNSISVAATKVGSGLSCFASPATGAARNFSKFTSTFGSGPGSNVAMQFSQIYLSSGNWVGPFTFGKAFTVAGVAYFPITTFTPLQSTWLLVDGSGRVCARAMYGNAGVTFAHGVGQLVSSLVSPSSSNIVYCPVLEQGTLTFVNGTPITPIGVSRIRLTFGRSTIGAAAWHSGTAKNMFFSGGLLMDYDGVQTTEAGFHYFPELITATDSGAGTGPDTGSHSYIALYEWTDGQGQRRQSDASPVVSVSATGHQVNVVVPAIQLGVMPTTNTIAIALYRTTVGGINFLRCASSANIATGLPNTVTIHDTSTDAGIAGNELLYTTGSANSPGNLANHCPGPCDAITTWQGRIVYSDSENKRLVRFSQIPYSISTNAGLYFNETLFLTPVPDDFGDITALAYMDDKLVVFSQSQKAVYSGDGPAANGLGGTYSATPIVIAVQHGCADQRSIAHLPDGIGYQSINGYYKLTRGLQEDYFGLPVENLLSGNTVCAAIAMTNTPQTMLVIQGGAQALVYDHVFNQWSTWTYPSMSMIGGVLYQGTYAFADTTNNVLWRENVGSLVDNFAGSLTSINGTIGLSWIKLANIAGFQRVRRVLLTGTTKASNNATVSMTVDFDYAPVIGSGPNTYTVNFGNSSSFVVSGLPLMIRHRLQQQKCQAITFVITDSPVLTSNSGNNYTGITLELGVKKGAAKLPAAQSF